MRKLGYIESIFHIFDVHNKILRNVVILAECDQIITFDFLKSSLENAMRKFAGLRLRVIEKNSLPYFIDDVKISDIALDEIYCPKLDFKTIMQYADNEANIAIDTSKAAWRGKFLVSEDMRYLILTLNHVIFDGRSIQKLLNFVFNKNSHTSLYKQGINIFPEIEKSIHREENKIDIEKLNVDSDKILKSWPYNQNVSLHKQRSQSIKINIDFLEVDKVKNYCRKNGITITALLNAIMLKSVAKTKNAPIDMLVHTPVDLSQYSKTHDYSEEIGCFVGIVKAINRNISPNENLIVLAEKYQTAFEKNKSMLYLMKEFDYQETKTNLTARLQAASQNFLGGIAISNLGNVISSNTERCDRMLIKDLYFTGSILGGLAIFSIGTLTFNNRFKLILGYTTPLVTEEFIMQFINEFENESKMISDKIRGSVI